jgi:dTDP-4-dehydrorhamnose 3,5-epimerase-like enzyme
MQFIETPFFGLYIINYTKFEDEKGFFARTFCKKKFSQIWISEKDRFGCFLVRDSDYL